MRWLYSIDLIVNNPRITIAELQRQVGVGRRAARRISRLIKNRLSEWARVRLHVTEV